MPLGDGRYMMIYHTGNSKADGSMEYDLDAGLLDLRQAQRDPASVVRGRIEHFMDARVAVGIDGRSGDTAHFDLVANEAARGIAQVSLETGVPLIFEVLATDTLAQAEARAGGAHGNKGWEAAESALEMASLLDALPGKEAR